MILKLKDCMFKEPVSGRVPEKIGMKHESVLGNHVTLPGVSGNYRTTSKYSK